MHKKLSVIVFKGRFMKLKCITKIVFITNYTRMIYDTETDDEINLGYAQKGISVDFHNNLPTFVFKKRTDLVFLNQDHQSSSHDFLLHQLSVSSSS